MDEISVDESQTVLIEPAGRRAALRSAGAAAMALLAALGLANGGNAKKN